LLNHTAKRVAQTADRIFGVLEPNCGTVVVPAADRFAIHTREKPAKLAQCGCADGGERGLEPPTPFMRNRNGKSQIEEKANEIAGFLVDMAFRYDVGVR